MDLNFWKLLSQEMLGFKRQNCEKEEKIVKLEEKSEDLQVQLEQKKHEAKKLAKEVKKLKRMLEEEKGKSQRNQRFNRIIDHNDNIDELNVYELKIPNIPYEDLKACCNG